MTAYIYRWNRQGRKGERCIVTALGTMNSCAVKFRDGYEMVTSRNAIMKDKTMTTTIKIQAAGHRVKVVQEHLDQNRGTKNVDETILEPGSGERTFYVHSAMNLHIEEIPIEAQEQKLAPIGTGERVTQDLQNYRDGIPTR